jgi:hypothetical protein
MGAVRKGQIKSTVSAFFDIWSFDILDFDKKTYSRNFVLVYIVQLVLSNYLPRFEVDTWKTLSYLYT